jgi:hypothetical protein
MNIFPMKTLWNVERFPLAEVQIVAFGVAEALALVQPTSILRKLVFCPEEFMEGLEGAPRQ